MTQLSIFYLGLIKLKVDTNFKKKVEKLKNKESVVAESTPISEKEFEVTLKIIDNDETLFSLKTITYSRDEAQKIIMNWKKSASKMYPKILGLISSEDIK